MISPYAPIGSQIGGVVGARAFFRRQRTGYPGNALRRMQQRTSTSRGSRFVEYTGRYSDRQASPPSSRIDLSTIAINLSGLPH
jgi:hypothetical protein